MVSNAKSMLYVYPNSLMLKCKYSHFIMQQILPVLMAVFVSLEGAVGVREGWRCAREGFGGLYVVEEGGMSMMLKLCADSWDSKTQVRYLYAASDTTPVLTKAHFHAIVCEKK